MTCLQPDVAVVATAAAAGIEELLDRAHMYLMITTLAEERTTVGPTVSESRVARPNHPIGTGQCIQRSNSRRLRHRAPQPGPTLSELTTFRLRIVQYRFRPSSGAGSRSPSPNGVPPFHLLYASCGIPVELSICSVRAKVAGLGS